MMIASIVYRANSLDPPGFFGPIATYHSHRWTHRRCRETRAQHVCARACVKCQAVGEAD